MYKVFLVDDEIVVREGVRNNIDWESTEFIFSGEAPDGEMALAMVQDIKPDILITDIKMPFLDGLALAKIVKRTMPWMRILILSGHDEFEYAKQAISVGVDDYILKPVGSQELLAALNKAAKSIEDQKKHSMDVKALQEQLDNTNVLVVEHFLNELVIGAVPVAEAVERARQMDIDLIAPCYLCVMVEISVEDECKEDLLKARALLVALLSERSDVIHFFSGADRLVLLLKGEAADDKLEDVGYELAQVIKYELERNLAVDVAAGIGSVVVRLGEIPKSFAHAERARRFLSVLERGQIIGIGDLEAGNSMLPQLDKAPVSEKIKYADLSNVDDIVGQVFHDDGQSQSILLGYYLLMDILMAAARFVGEIGGTPGDVLPEIEHPEALASVAASREELICRAKDVLERTLRFRDESGDMRYGTIIRAARSYIEENYADPGISLHTVAQSVSLSPNHFSTVFSQQNGQTFIEYLTQVRLTHARELLSNTRMRASEIATAVGYNEPQYFSYIFRKNVGVTPRAYRAQCDEEKTSE